MKKEDTFAKNEFIKSLEKIVTENQLQADKDLQLKEQEEKKFINEVQVDSEQVKLKTIFDFGFTRSDLPFYNENRDNIIRWFESLKNVKRNLLKCSNDQVIPFLKKWGWDETLSEAGRQAQIHGKSAIMLYVDEVTNKIEKLPMKIINMTKVMNKVTEITLTNLDFITHQSEKYIICWSFILHEHNVYLSNWLTASHGSILDPSTQINIFKKIGVDYIRNYKLIMEKVDHIIPVTIMVNNFEEMPTTRPIENKLKTVSVYEQVLQLLPKWEMGALIDLKATVSDIKDQNQIMTNIMTEKVISKTFKTGEGQYLSAQQLSWFSQPQSIMQTTSNTKKQLQAELAQALGMPTLDEIKSAQKTEQEVSLSTNATDISQTGLLLLHEQFLNNFLKNILLYNDYLAVRHEELPNYSEDIKFYFEDKDLGIDTPGDNNNEIQRTETEI